ncbi:LytTR family DNA-binding domain-containing protein [Parascardovia denticolens]|uniref:LytTR family DNA-binding domain-containing protein n=1 Tax=Parascardovia denticolens TaxID=78258 RepID=UPI001E4B6383|nr:LytTR family DNA-binding domain-containing protein [Parascardovia denticolens]
MEGPGERVLNSVGSMQEASDRLGDKGFLRCDRQHLVNVRQIESISGSTVTLVDGDELPIGRAYKKDFFAQLAQELGAGYAA